ncbi:MAG TPA: ABC transporter ATP-binding protein [Microvirga sp.]|jgi:oligopeptide transport system ATP-binding protein|nr:ABC transporter ATP-binding protein [Microvirga sp.]
MAEPVLSVRDLNVRFRTGDGILHAVKGISLDVQPGETVAIVGESGSGKSQTMMSVMGLLASNGWAEGSVKYRGEELVGLKPDKLNRYRGSKLTMIFQEPMTSLDPLYRIGDQLALPLTAHGGLSKAEARKRSIELLELVRIPEPARRLDSYPHELSGGQRQRVMIAMALANNPDVLIADEPTTALDVTVQARILELLADLQKRLGMSIVFITHDLGVVRRFADRTYVMRSGEVVESGTTADLFAAPKHPYTRMLIDAEPRGRKEPVPASAPVVLEARNIQVTFNLKGGFLGKGAHVLRAVDDVSLTVRAGETVGIVGESGSGKSTLGRAILRLQPAAGLVRFEDRNLMPLDRAGMRPLRRRLQVVFQDPFGSLSPRMTAGEIVTEGLLVHEPAISRRERDRRAIQAFEEVRLDPAWRNRYPHEFSGGQRQRIAIARAMILHPKLVILDEPTSALDRSVQKEVVDLLRDLQKAHGLAYVFISHDLAVVRALSDEILVMKSGKVVERGTAESIFERPREAYTRDLIAAAFLQERTPAAATEADALAS